MRRRRRALFSLKLHQFETAHFTVFASSNRRVMELCRWKELRIARHPPDRGLFVLQLPRRDLNPPLEVIVSNNISNQVVLLSLSCCLLDVDDDDREEVKRCWSTITTWETVILSPLKREATDPTKWQWLELRARRWEAWAERAVVLGRILHWATIAFGASHLSPFKKRYTAETSIPSSFL